MFKLILSNTFTQSVLFQIPGDSAPIQGEFTGIFNRLTQSELEKIADPATRPTDDDLLNQVFAGWMQDLGDADGKPLDVSAENRALLLNVAGMKRAIIAAFINAQADAGPRAKN